MRHCRVEGIRNQVERRQVDIAGAAPETGRRALSASEREIPPRRKVIEERKLKTE
jgi:hypothetical protein